MVILSNFGVRGGLLLRDGEYNNRGYESNYMVAKNT